MRVLGIDPGSARTGFGVVEKSGNRYRCVEHGEAGCSRRLDLPRRLHAIVERVGEVMDRVRPDCVAVEEAFYHLSVRSTLVLGHVRGALLVAAVQRGLAVAEYSPREVKMSVAGSGAAAKEQVAYMVRRLLGVRGALPSDAADALAVALCHLHRERRQLPAARAMSAAAERLEALLATRAARGAAAVRLASLAARRGGAR
ncbi:MAG TPA: crossover junction endodeoxyribonuclease RuvC [Candidatus Eisenbacteria bacterium]|jgi:crossover junction endodeoxyribonuclease RuvC